MANKIPSPPVENPDERAHRRQIAQAVQWLLENWADPSASGGAEDSYPVGSIYIATVATDPATLLGFGTWARVAKGRCLIGEGTGTGLTARTAGATGGQEDAIVPNHTHTIDHGHNASSNNTGSHVHTQAGGNDNNNNGNRFGYHSRNERNASTGSAGAHSHVITVDSHSGSSGAASGGESVTDKNMQPYLVVYIWERTA